MDVPLVEDSDTLLLASSNRREEFAFEDAYQQ